MKDKEQILVTGLHHYEDEHVLKLINFLKENNFQYNVYAFKDFSEVEVKK